MIFVQEENLGNDPVVGDLNDGSLGVILSNIDLAEVEMEDSPYDADISENEANASEEVEMAGADA